MKVTVFDYGAGNLHSLVKALEGAARDVQVEADASAALQTDVLVVPGVGAFGPAAAALAEAREELRSAIRGGLPCIGICLGMQLLFDGSDEGDGDGLGVFAGRVTRLAARRVPQIGWNQLEDVRDPLMDAAGLTTAYFANGYACRVPPSDAGSVLAWSTHEQDRFPAAVRRGAVVGMQFHPEKSSLAGVRYLRLLLTEVRR